MKKYRFNLYNERDKADAQNIRDCARYIDNLHGDEMYLYQNDDNTSDEQLRYVARFLLLSSKDGFVFVDRKAFYRYHNELHHLTILKFIKQCCFCGATIDAEEDEISDNATHIMFDYDTIHRTKIGVIYKINYDAFNLIGETKPPDGWLD